MSKIAKKINMAIITGLVATTTVIIAPIAIAQPGAEDARGGKGGSKGNRGGQSAERKFARIDSSEDGLLDLTEMTAKVDDKAQRMLDKKDADEDGALSLVEFSTNRRGEVKDLSDIADEIVQCVTDLKAQSGNEDIVIPSATDFLSPEARFNDLDSTSNGALELDELQAGGLAKATARFEGMDADDSLDVTLEEFEAAINTHRATKGAIRQCVHEINDDDEV